MVGMKKLAKSVARVCVVVVLLVLVIGIAGINLLMFPPGMVKGGYDESTPGYVDIGTNGVKIAAVVLGPERGDPPSQELRRGKKALIRCHGNAEDMMGTLWALGDLAERGYTIAAVDYPGYGRSDGSPTEEGCYRNVHRLYDWLVETRGFKPEDIIVDGFSIGSGPATELAATKPVGGLILEAPFLSAPRVVTKVRILPIDPFPNLKRIGDVKCPVLFFHGTEDRVIPYSHGRALFELAREPKRFITIEGGDHNDFPAVMGVDEYLQEIRNFADSCGKQEVRDE
jgi:pimeloyl-ACP methyl ester carboxylesterase